MLIFLLQSIWLYIKELAGKDLEFDVVFKFLLYVSPRLIVLVLPLTILLASIMVFGNFAEKYEFAAMKSTGISLQRAMRSVSSFIFGLAVLTFFFANNVIPKAEFNFYNLRKNIAKVKPAFAIAEGQFNQLGDMNIKVAEKSGENGEFLDDVIIHQKKKGSAGNHTVMKAVRGELVSEEESDILQLILFEGHYYDEVQPKDIKDRQKLPLVKSYFDRHIINIDLAKLSGDVDFEDKGISNKYSMLGINDLSYTIDSLLVNKVDDFKDVSTNMYNRSTASTLALNYETKEVNQPFEGESLFEMFRAEKNIQLIDNALNSVRSSIAILDTRKQTFAVKEKNLNKHIFSFYEKFALGFACIILFFVGAPLGALIKKGGFGLPIVVAIILFLLYHFIGIFAKNSAEDSSLNPVLATWLSTLIMLPLSIYLTNQATKDRSLLNLDVVLVPIKKLLSKATVEAEASTAELDHSTETYQKLSGYSQKKLIDVIKNYRQYDLDITYKNTAVHILGDRGISEEELRLGGHLTNENYETALRLKNQYDINSTVTLRLYIIALIGDVVGAILNNNGFEVLGIILITIGVLATIAYLIYFFRGFDNLSKFYKIVDKSTINVFAVLILGIPLYFLFMYYYRNRLKVELKQIR